MTTKKTEAGRLTVKQRRSKPALVQLSHLGHVFNLSRAQLSGAVAAELRQNPGMLEGAEVQFEPRNGQPWNVEFYGAPPALIQDVPNKASWINHPSPYPDLEVGLIRSFRFDHGFVVAESDGRDDIRFYTDCLVDQDWRPNEGDAVTFVRQNNIKSPIARRVVSLRECTDSKIIEYCGNSEQPTLWKPVAEKYLQSVQPETQLRWIYLRERYLAAGLNIKWWLHVDADVLCLPAVLKLLPLNVAATAISSALVQLDMLELGAQVSWLSDRKQFLTALTSSAWAKISVEVLWESSCWELLPLAVKANVLSKIQTRASVLQLLCKLDEPLQDELDQKFIVPFLRRILASSDPEVERQPRTWSLIARYAHTLAIISPESLAQSRSLAASVCIYPEIEKHLPEIANADCSLIRIIRPYAKFAAESHFDLSGTTQFSSLEPEDMILAASYMAATQDGREICSELFDGRFTREQWSWASISSSIEARSEDTSRAWSNFLVRGLQPRIAEIAFGTIHSALQLGDGLVDINRQALKELQRWTVNDVRNAFIKAGKEVREDWKDGRRRYDVKCNLYFRSKEKLIGLRGLLINVAAELAAINEAWLPGFVFYASSDYDCSWSFVGLFNPKAVPNRNWTGRVAPFYFMMPDTHRLQHNAHLSLADASLLSVFVRSVFSNHNSSSHAGKACHPIIPLLHCDDSIELSHLSKPQALLFQSVTKAIASLRTRTQTPVPTERILWISINRLVFDARNAGENAETVALALKEACELVRNPWLPVVAAKVDNSTLLELWIGQVLSALNKHWSSISCPQCGGSGSKLKLEPLNSSAELSIWGSLRCTCGFSADDVTLFTHCHKCSSYPLVIGLSRICSECHGLRCHVVHDGVECGTCKKTCTRVNSRSSIDAD
jgi:hypothetical protein